MAAAERKALGLSAPPPGGAAAPARAAAAIAKATIGGGVEQYTDRGAREAECLYCFGQ